LIKEVVGAPVTCAKTQATLGFSLGVIFMNKRLSIAGALTLAIFLTYSPAFTQSAPDKKTEEATTSGSAVEGTKPKTARRVLKVDPVDGKLVSPYSLAERTALSRQDCLPNNLHKDGLGMHGQYRTYGQWDPQLKSIEGKRQYEACVKRGLDPTPWFAFGQRMLIATNGKFFGKTKESCLTCHSKY
jgi:hypothetical protein